MPKKPSIAVIGAGRLGVPLAEALAKAGYPVREIVYRDAQSAVKRNRNLPSGLRSKATSWKTARLDADIVWLCVPDGQIQPAASHVASHAGWKSKIAFHSSGALSSDALRALRKRGALVASVHPLMTFVQGSKPQLKGVPFGLEGDPRAVASARKIVKALHGEPFKVRKQDKVLYHAWGTFLSPLLLSFMTTAEHLARVTAIPAQSARKKMFPIVMQTLSNYTTRGPAQSFSGPIVRGDAAIVAAHLKALEKIPEAREVYIALAKSALRHLPVRNRKQLELLLKKKNQRSMSR
jgi:predicted short-subunit dehydrogenase-like oxidoreductase (DUF2520 family)